MSSWIRTGLYCVSLVLMVGCASSGPVPENSFYRLVELNPQPIQGEQPLDGLLLVERVKASGILRERALLYSRDGSPEAVKQHHYHHWIDLPASLIREQLVTYLRQSNTAPFVATSTRSQTPRYQLGMELKKLERRLLESGGVEVEVALRVEVVTASRDQPLLLKDYSSKRRHDDSQVLSSVREINKALAEIYGELVKDLVANVSATN